MTGCPLCGLTVDRRLLAKSHHLRAPIQAQIQGQEPNWKPAQGICPACALVFANHFATQRSGAPLSTSTNPHSTFPYYHPEEETTYSQPERLPDYQHFDGSGVTIAFLDSGYYPHPDLTEKPCWPDPPAWEELDSAQMRTFLSQRDLRIVQYVDLTNQSEWLGPETPSLWDGAGDSWHGQMTSVVAAGNGLLSNGRFRGYAHGSRLLPIKIGRSGGRIPEDDILSGLEWLLKDDNWLRYGVRVLNLSVGGDHAQPWRQNPVCLAAEELSERGVFIVAAAGNSQLDRLLAPAQSPSVLTVGGVDDANLPWHLSYQNNLQQMSLYEHNWGTVQNGPDIVHKPELLALAKWLPSPILPATPVFKEMHAISSLRSTLYGKPNQRQDALLAHWHRTLYLDPLYTRDHPGQSRDAWLAEIEQALRKRMNTHKWVHAFYQHVDGTSVAAAQVSAVAAQMIQANPALTPAQTKALLMQTAYPLTHLPFERSGKGLLQPAAAVAGALRMHNGALTGYPHSASSSGGQHGTACRYPSDPIRNELHKQGFQGTVPATRGPASPDMHPVYFGIFAAGAWDISLIGTFNDWTPDVLPLQQGRNGWWYLELPLAPGFHLYRFWIVDSHNPTGNWRPDPENPCQVESGYDQCHSAVYIHGD